MSANNDLMLDVGQAEELKLAFRRHGWTNAKIKTLSEGDILGEVLKVLNGQAEIKVIEHLIDCDAAPYAPPGLTVEKHIKGGFWKWNPKIGLHLVRGQKKGFINGHDLIKLLAKMPVLNANVLDWLLAHPELIPEEWKGKAVFFWGTIYRDSDGGLYVRYLRWVGSRWRWCYYWLGHDFDSALPAALAS